MSAVNYEILKKIRRIQIMTSQLASDTFAGSYRSAFKGRGMEFEEVREYQPGDEIRTIDWNVTARMNHFYVKTFREERDLTALLVVDVSGSSRFGSHYGLKSELIAEIGAVLAFSAIKNNDRIGLVLFSDIVEKYIPPSKGTRHVLHIIRELLLFRPKSKGSDLKSVLAFIGNVFRKRGVCFLISDFIASDYSKEVGLIARKHDLISICVNDPAELNFPNLGLVNLEDLETNKSAVIDSASPTVRNHFQQSAAKRLTDHQHLINKVGASYIDIRTDQPYINALRKFFKLREKRRR